MSPQELIELVQQGKSVVVRCGGRMPAAFFANMQFYFVMRQLPEARVYVPKPKKRRELPIKGLLTLSASPAPGDEVYWGHNGYPANGRLICYTAMGDAYVETGCRTLFIDPERLRSSPTE